MAATPLERDASCIPLRGGQSKIRSRSRALFWKRPGWTGGEYRWESGSLNLGRPVWNRIEQARAAI